MNEVLKYSPLCVGEGGGEIYFTARHAAQKYRVVFSKEMLDAVLSPQATEDARKAWVAAERHKLGGVLSKTEAVPAHLASVVIEEIP